MRTTIALDDTLVAKAQAFTGLTKKSALVRGALKALIEREARIGLRCLVVASPRLSLYQDFNRGGCDTGRHRGVDRSSPQW